MDEDFDYDRWYPEVPAVMDAKQLAELLQTSDQIIRLWVRRASFPPTVERAAASSTSFATRSSNGSWQAGTCLGRTSSCQSLNGSLMGLRSSRAARCRCWRGSAAM